jgi:hypothetical protein
MVSQPRCGHDRGRYTQATAHALSRARLGSKKNPYDQCIYTRGKGENKIYVATHVDDLLILSRNIDNMLKFEEELSTKYEITTEHHPTSYLGMQLDRDSTAGTIKLSLPSYSQKMVNKFLPVRASSPQLHLHQTIVALSSTEASEACRDILWFRSYLSNLGWSQPPSTILFQDNLSCMDIANNLDTNERTKHIDIKYHFIKDHINKGTLKMEYLPTTEMTADILTKALPYDQFVKLRDQLMRPTN